VAALRRAAAFAGAIGVLVTLFPSPSASADSPRVIGSVAVATCDVVEVPGSQAWCGVLERPWDPTNPSVGTFLLSFAIVLPNATAPSQPAVVGLEGGPGYGSIASGQGYADMLGPLMADRALLVVDQRGTGRSAPARCPSLDSYLPWGRATAECATRLGNRATLYASALAADDMAALVGALRLGKVDLYGDSYGTFMAQVIAGHHPEIVRSMIVDGAYPVTGETAWYPTTAPAMRASFDVVCERTPSCARRAGSTIARLRAVLDVVRAAPAHVRAPGVDGRMHNVTVDAPTLVGTAFNATYVQTTYREMDAALRAALLNDWLPLGRLVADFQFEGASASGGIGYSDAEFVSVSCHDYPQLFDPSSSVTARREQINAAVRLEERENPGVYGPFTVREFRASDWSSLDLCTTWPAGSRDPSRQPAPPSGAYPDIPVLVISGELDSITTPAEADMVARQFPRSRHVIVANGLHVNAAGNAVGCAPSLVRAFLRDSAAVLAAPDQPCSVAQIRGMPAYPRTATRLSTPYAIAQTIADVLDRIWAAEITHGLGLRGGTWRYSGWPQAAITLRSVELYDGFPVSGRVSWDVDGSELTATVRAEGQTWTASWNTQATGAQATMTRVGDGGARTVRFLAP